MSEHVQRRIRSFEIQSFVSTFVNYFGTEIQIPRGNFKWIATDEDGTVAVYEKKPQYVESSSGDYWAPGRYEYEILGDATCFKGCVKDSFMEIK